MASYTVMAPIHGEIQRLSNNSRIAGYATIVAAIVVLGSLGYAASELAKLQAERLAQEEKLSALEAERRHVETELSEAKVELSTAREEITRVRSASEYLRIGLNNFHSRNYKGAVSAYDRAISLDADNALLYDLRGYAFFRDKQLEKAVASLETSIQIAPGYIWGHYNLALAYWAIDRKGEAVQEIRTVLELAPDFRDIIAGDGQFSSFKSSEKFRSLMAGE